MIQILDLVWRLAAWIDRRLEPPPAPPPYRDPIPLPPRPTARPNYDRLRIEKIPGMHPIHPWKDER